jgi:hypothetical protein
MITTTHRFGTTKHYQGLRQISGPLPFFGNPVMAANDRLTRPVVTTSEARSGVTGHNIRYVLIFGLGGVIVAFGIIFYAFFR